MLECTPVRQPSWSVGELRSAIMQRAPRTRGAEPGQRKRRRAATAGSWSEGIQ